jgi:hypothetical protein
MSNSIKEFKKVFKNYKINEYGNIILPDTNQCLTCGRYPEDRLTFKESYLLKNNKRLLKKLQNTFTGRNITENEMKNILSQAFILEKIDNKDTSSTDNVYRLGSLIHIGTYLLVKNDLSGCYSGDYKESNNNLQSNNNSRHITEEECRKISRKIILKKKIDSDDPLTGVLAAIPERPSFTKWSQSYDWPDGCFRQKGTNNIYYVQPSNENRWPLLEETDTKNKKQIISSVEQLCKNDGIDTVVDCKKNKKTNKKNCSSKIGQENCPPLIRMLTNKSKALMIFIQESDFIIQNIVVNNVDLEDPESKLYKFIESNNVYQSIKRENYYDSFIQYIKLNKLLLHDYRQSHETNTRDFKTQLYNLASVQKKNKKYPKIISSLKQGVDILRDEYKKNTETVNELKNKKQMNIRNSLLSFDTYNKIENLRYVIKVIAILLSITVTLFFLYLSFKKKIQVSKSSMVLFLVILLLIILGIIFI